MGADQTAMGQRLRELRLARGLQQGEAARRLGISAAYLSLIEKGKRTIQLPLVAKALELYGVGIEEFMQSLGERRADEGLARMLDDPLLRSLDLSEADLANLSGEPKVATTVAALFNLYKNTRSQLDNVLATLAREERYPVGTEDEGSLRFDYSPFDEVTDFLEARRNWFPNLENRAERCRKDWGLGQRVTSDELARALEAHMGITVRHVSSRDPSSVVRSWDAERGVLSVSTHLFEQRLKFQLAHTAALRIFDEETLHEAVLGDYSPRHQESLPLIKLHLANYFAGALLLPYEDFFRELKRTRYDVELLASLFESTYETVAHRICNMGDPKRRGVPMHFMRVDVAGNVSKRYAGDGIRIPPYGGSCAKRAVHLAFLTPNVIAKQYSRFPDGSTYFEFARVVTEAKAGSLARGTVYSIGLGCPAEDAKHLAYADDVPLVDPDRMVVPVGASCRFCERTDCNMRSAPSYKFAFRVDEHVRKDNFFSPLVSKDDRSDVKIASEGDDSSDAAS